MIRRGLAVFAFVAAGAHVSARPAAQPKNACGLLTKTEIAAVQGQPFSSTKLTAAGAKSQCFYELPSFVRSVSVDVLRDDAAGYWQQHFSEAARKQREAARVGKRKKEDALPVAGIGRAAFWTGNRTGSLHVFRGDAVLRISVGGPGTQEEKIARAKRLAARALKRM